MLPIILKPMRKCVEDNFGVTVKRRPRSINFVHVNVQVDLLAGGRGVTPRNFLDFPQEEASSWATPLTKYQCKWIEKQPLAYKDVVRLAKYWRNIGALPTGSKPKSCLLELLVLASYRETDKPLRLRFIDFLRYLIRMGEEGTLVYWRHYYGDVHVERAVLFGRLIGSRGILDPANPANNLWLTVRDPEPLVEYARETLATLCSVSDLDNLLRCAGRIDADLAAAESDHPVVKNLKTYFQLAPPSVIDSVQVWWSTQAASSQHTWRSCTCDSTAF